MSAGDEQVAVYDAAGAVTGAAPRGEVYRLGLWHAATGVLVFLLLPILVIIPISLTPAITCAALARSSANLASDRGSNSKPSTAFR